jgi:hypothetical protein
MTLLLLGCLARVPKADVLYEWSESHQAGAHTLEQIGTDREVFRSTCGECHLPPAAKWFETDEWPKIVERMNTRHDAGVDDATREQVLRYLDLAHAWDASVREERRGKK